MVRNIDRIYKSKASDIKFINLMINQFPLVFLHFWFLFLNSTRLSSIELCNDLGIDAVQLLLGEDS